MSDRVATQDSGTRARTKPAPFKLRMLRDLVAVKRKNPTVTPGGIIVPDLYVHDSNVGVVVSAGPESGLEPGDTVIVSRWDCTELADSTVERIGQRDPVAAMKAENICMRNGSPTAGRIAVKLDPRVRSLGLLALPDAVTEQPTTGEVIAAGKGAGCKVGDRVLTGKFNGTQLEPRTCSELGHEGAEIWVMREGVLTQHGKHWILSDETYGVIESEQAS